MKIAAVIITYNPDIAVLIDNVNTISNQVGSVLIVDNSSHNIHDIVRTLPKETEVYFESENVGIAKATNDGINFFKLKEFDWVLTLDQDSVVPKNYVKCLINDEDFKNVGMIAPIIYNNSDAAGKANHQYDKLPANLVNKTYIYNDIYQEALHVIASGALINIETWHAVGKMDEYLFIDRVDYDFNMKLLINNYLILQKNVVLNHKLGSPIQKNIFSKKLYSLNHSAFRKYYIFRNSIIMAKRYGNKSQEFKKLFKQLACIVLIEDNKIKKMFSAFKGTFDGILYGALNNRMKVK